jgi:hypothetical protein
MFELDWTTNTEPEAVATGCYTQLSYLLEAIEPIFEAGIRSQSPSRRDSVFVDLPRFKLISFVQRHPVESRHPVATALGSVFVGPSVFTTSTNPHYEDC